MLCNKRIILDEIGNTVSHGLGIPLIIIGILLFIFFHKHITGTEKIIGLTIFFICLLLTYTISTLFHSLIYTKAKHVFIILDHCSIFLLIAGTYTPFILLSLKGYLLIIDLGIFWIVTVTGIVLKAVFLKKLRKLSLAIYLILGWSIIFFAKPLSSSLTLPIALLLLAGGLSYTCGVPFFINKKIPFSHMIWHLFVLMGSIFHFLAIYYFI